MKEVPQEIIVEAFHDISKVCKQLVDEVLVFEAQVYDLTQTSIAMHDKFHSLMEKLSGLLSEFESDNEE